MTSSPPLGRVLRRLYRRASSAVGNIHVRKKENPTALRWQWDLLKAEAYAVRIAHGIPTCTGTLKEFRELCLRSSMFGKHYSLLCPQGEKGDAHRCAFLAVVAKETFEAAREQERRTWTGFEG